MDTLRIFAAADFGVAAKEEFVRQFERLNLSVPDIRPQLTEKYHVTLRFWAHLPINDVQALMSVMAEAAGQIDAFPLVLAKTMVQKQTLIIDVDAPELENLHRIFQSLVAQHDLDAESGRRFRPHLTVARYKERLSQDAEEKFKAWKPEVDVVIDRLSLYQSELRPDQSQFTLLQSWNL